MNQRIPGLLLLECLTFGCVACLHAQETPDALSTALLDPQRSEAAAQEIIESRKSVLASIRHTIRQCRRGGPLSRMRDALRLAGTIRAVELVDDLFEVVTVGVLPKGDEQGVVSIHRMYARIEWPAVDALIAIGLPAVHRGTVWLAGSPTKWSDLGSPHIRRIIARVLGEDAKMYLRARITEYERAGEQERKSNLEGHLQLLTQEMAAEAQRSVEKGPEGR